MERVMASAQSMKSRLPFSSSPRGLSCSLSTQLGMSSSVSAIAASFRLRLSGRFLDSPGRREQTEPIDPDETPSERRPRAEFQSHRNSEAALAQHKSGGRRLAPSQPGSRNTLTAHYRAAFTPL